MAPRSSTVAAAVVLFLAVGAQAKRTILQVPQFQSTGINVQGANGGMQESPAVTTTAQETPTATTTAQASPDTVPAAGTPVLPASPALAPGASANIAPPVASPPVIPPTTQPVVLPPAQAPVQAPTVPPTLPPVTQPPVIQPPVPAPSAPVLPVAPVVPAPAPSSPPVQAPVPAPSVLPLPLPLAPVPAPVPAPQPVAQPPQCGQQPQCRLFVEDMLCCENAGALTNKQHAVMRLQCTHPVNYAPGCFTVDGPSNTTSFQQFDTDVWSQTHAAQLNILGGYKGNVTVDIEAARTGPDANMCGLYITPCLYNGQLVDTVAPVNSLSFTTIPTDDFIEVAENIMVDLDDLDNLVFPNMYYPQSCQQQNIGNLNATFYNEAWVNYTMGNTYQCNYTAFVDALAPSPAAAAVAMPVVPLAVSG